MTLSRATSRILQALPSRPGWHAAVLFWIVCSPTLVWGQVTWSIVKTHSGNFSRGGAGSYVISVANTGSAASTGTVQVTDSLPPSLSYTGFTGLGWSCSPSSVIACSRTDSLSAGLTYPSLTITVSVASSAPASVVNAASVSGGGASGSANTNDPTTIGAPSLSITKTHTGNFVAGGSGTYTLVVTNTGNGPTLAPQIVQIFDNPPSGMTVTAISGTGWLCANGSLVGCNRGDALAAGASYPPVTVTVSIAANATTPLVNVATAQGGGASGTSTASDPTTIQGPPSLAITKTHTGNFIVGQTGAYTLTVRNTGTGPTLSPAVVQVFDTPPTGMTVTGMTGTGWFCQTSPTAGCNRGDALAAGSSYPTITATVSIAANAPASLTNQATVSGGGAASGATTSDPTTILGPPILTIAKTHTGNFTAGQQGTYTLTVGNTGTGPTGSQFVQVFDTPPAGMTVASMTGTGWSCSAGPASSGCTRNDALPGGASFPPITVTVNIDAAATSPLANVATVTGGGTTTTITATDPTVIAPPVSWTVQKTHTGNFTAGQQGTYTVVIRNSGNGASPAGALVNLTDNLPSGMTLRSISGTGWTCSVGSASAVCGRTDSLAAGASFPPLTVTVDVAANAPSTLTNTVTLNDHISANITASDPTTIAPPGNGLTLTKRHFGNFLVNQPGLYTLTVTNGSQAAISGTVSVQESAPSGMTITSMSGTGWTCAAATCSRQDNLAIGRSYPTISVVVSLSPQIAPSVTNNATLSVGGSSLSISASDPTVVETGAARILSIGGSGQSAPLGTLFFSPIQVMVTTPSGSPLTGTPVTFTTPASGPSGVWPNGQRTVTVTTNSAGVADAPALRANNLTGSYSLTASVGAQPGAPSVALQMSNTGALLPNLTSPPLLSFDFANGNAPPQTQLMTVDNGTGGPTPFSYRIVYPNPEAGAWVSAVPTTLTTPAVFKVTVSPGGFGPGRYLALIVVTPLTSGARPAVAAELNHAAARLSGQPQAGDEANDTYTSVVKSIGIAPGGAGPFSLAPLCNWVSSDITKPNSPSDIEKKIPCTYVAALAPATTTIGATIAQGNPTDFTASLTFASPQTDWLTARLGTTDIPIASSVTTGAKGSGNSSISVVVRPTALKRDSESAFLSAVLAGRTGGDIATITTAVGKTFSAATHTINFDTSAGPLTPVAVTLGAIGGTVPFRAVPDAPWLTVDPPSGVVTSGNPTTLTLTADPSGLGAAQFPATVTIQRTDDASKGPEVLSVTLNNAPAGAPQITEVVNGGSFGGEIAPGAWVSIKGVNLASATRLWDDSIVNGRLPTTLAGVSVTINGIPAYVQFVSPTQINVASPSDRPQDDAPVVVRNNGVPSAPVSVKLQPLAPAFLHRHYDLGNYIVAQRLSAPAANYIGNPAAGNFYEPAKPGDILALWITGLGPTQPPVPEGIEPGLEFVGRLVASPVTVFLAGREAPAANYFGAAISQFAATYQINIRVPDTVPDGDVPVTVKVGDYTSPDGFVIYVKR
jgi:uncharacterized protein (TIGR03437 family)